MPTRGDRSVSDVGGMLRDWRAMRGMSQLDLSIEAGVSQRHLSFIESGRSIPGREKLMDLAAALDVPLRERNALLLAAGYAPRYVESGWDSPAMAPITDAVRRMLHQQEPYPAVLMDRWWNVLASNEASPRFFGRFVDLEARPKPRNLLHLMFDPAGVRPFIKDWPQVSGSLLERVRREATGRVLDQQTRELLRSLSAYDTAVLEPHEVVGRAGLPMIPLSFEKDGWSLSYFSLVTTVGTPATITADELRIEIMFPADEATERRHLDFIER